MKNDLFGEVQEQIAKGFIEIVKSHLTEEEWGRNLNLPKDQILLEEEVIADPRISGMSR